MALVKFNKTSTLALAKAALDTATIFFPTDANCVVLAGKEYGGVTEAALDAILANIDNDITDIDDKVDLIREEFNLAQIEIGAVETDAVPTENSPNFLTSGAIYTALLNLATKEIELLTTPVNIKPNILYKLGTRNTLTVGFISGEQGVVNEYMFEFTVGSSSFTLTLPNTVKWIEEPDFEIGYIYQVSIINNLAVTAGWEVGQ